MTQVMGMADVCHRAYCLVTQIFAIDRCWPQPECMVRTGVRIAQYPDKIQFLKHDIEIGLIR